MKKYVLPILRGMFLGIAIGLGFSLFFCYLYRAKTYYPSSPAFVNKFDRPLNAMAVSVLLWMLMGLVFSAGAYIFSIKSWSPLKQTIINFLIYYLGFSPLAVWAGWFPMTWPNFGIFTLIFILTYVIVWTISSHIAKKEVQQINDQLKK
ncbi:DUF3021 domain-containing protein [Lactobacillus sp.]|uniref:DUF3021 domain-containing protein n=1 Tax=Lactobacillus sp. TaxID=1591 RepID=UPI003EF8378B